MELKDTVTPEKLCHSLHTKGLSLSLVPTRVLCQWGKRLHSKFVASICSFIHLKEMGIKEVDIADIHTGFPFHERTDAS